MQGHGGTRVPALHLIPPSIVRDMSRKLGNEQRRKPCNRKLGTLKEIKHIVCMANRAKDLVEKPLRGVGS